jgi:hypothetical protein
MDGMGRRCPAATLAAVLILMAAPGSGGAQGNTTGPDTLAFPDRRSWEVAGVPALAFDSDAASRDGGRAAAARAGHDAAA